ncbi:PI-PLC X domain-containing protein 1-like [Pollicipes pollicipes]|uniref:PI-PLC X domain-containing protein 1-like n=1 Tax=Pollicipes pollicipes TaxID=41117 RepID=UPI001884EE88|nr:PI-PLC X domain-containing protein 1-like [Pollicipes pollicipes]
MDDTSYRERQTLSTMSLDQVMIPGTHNSGTYKRSRNIVFKLVATQDEDVWSQLMFGNRYLDLRIGHRPSERKPFWIYHDFFPVRPINLIINQVKWFMNNSREVVILDFHRFPVGFESSTVHDQFVQYLMMELSRWMAPRVYDVTMGELWASDKRLIVSYADWQARRRNEYLWPTIPQAWGNKRSVSELYGYLRQQMVERAGGPQWAAMAELTPSPWDILIPNRGLRDLAEKVNPEVTKWFRDEWWHSASVVATDFFLGNDMVDVAIEANIKRKQCVAGLGRRFGAGRFGAGRRRLRFAIDQAPFGRAV